MTSKKEKQLPSGGGVMVIPRGFNALTINSAKFRKDSKSLSIKFYCMFPKGDKQEGADEVNSASYSVESNIHAHQDLVKCFKRLGLHVLFLTDYLDEKIFGSDVFEDLELWLDEDYEGDKHPLLSERVKTLLEKTTINGVSTTGQIDIDGVTIMATRKNTNEQAYAINTPHTRLDSDYAFCDQLMNDLERLQSELRLYLEGKCEWNGQMDIFDENYADSRVRKLPAKASAKEAQPLPFGDGEEEQEWHEADSEEDNRDGFNLI